MKKLVLLALLAIALPTAAFADSFDYGNVGGTFTGSKLPVGPSRPPSPRFKTSPPTLWSRAAISGAWYSPPAQ